MKSKTLPKKQGINGVATQRQIWEFMIIPERSNHNREEKNEVGNKDLTTSLIDELIGNLPTV